MWCCGSCGSEGVTGKFIVSKPTSNQQFHTQEQFEAQQPAHSQAPPLRRVQMVHALASEPLKVTLRYVVSRGVRSPGPVPAIQAYVAKGGDTKLPGDCNKVATRAMLLLRQLYLLLLGLRGLEALLGGAPSHGPRLRQAATARGCPRSVLSLRQSGQQQDGQTQPRGPSLHELVQGADQQLRNGRARESPASVLTCAQGTQKASPADSSPHAPGPLGEPRRRHKGRPLTGCCTYV